MTHRVFVDGKDKGQVFRKKGHWCWQRGSVAIEMFARKAVLADVAEWARKCCNGAQAVIKREDAGESVRCS